MFLFVCFCYYVCLFFVCGLLFFVVCLFCLFCFFGGGVGVRVVCFFSFYYLLHFFF